MGSCIEATAEGSAHANMRLWLEATRRPAASGVDGPKIEEAKRNNGFRWKQLLLPVSFLHVFRVRCIYR
jgi:hypothetical protein